MTTQEFSIEFDILYNNLASNTAPPLNEYEKSVFLTKAQSDIVLELYSGRNDLGLSFESSEEIRRYLHPLIKTEPKTLSPALSSVIVGPASTIGAYTSDLPTDLLAILKEVVVETTTSGSNVFSKKTPVVPVSNDEYFYIATSPFKGPKSGKRALRLEESDKITILIKGAAANATLTYYVTYLSRPTPIILDVANDAMTIDGVNIIQGEEISNPTGNVQECKLDPSLHRMILDRAVLYAKQAYIGGQAQE